MDAVDDEEEVSSIPGQKKGPHLVKRRVSVVFGYLGTNYKGLQLQPGNDTIEAVLVKSIAAMGGISVHNKDRLQKIGWSRSSRTDKGVHSAGTVVSYKMLVEKDSLSPPDPKDETNSTQIGPDYARRLVQKLNEALPPDVRVFEIRRERGNFLAREHCTYRRYEYLIPASILNRRLAVQCSSSSTTDTHSRFGNLRRNKDLNLCQCGCALTSVELSSVPLDLDRLRNILQKWEGSHNMHNYTSGGHNRTSDRRDTHRNRKRNRERRKGEGEEDESEEQESEQKQEVSVKPDLERACDTLQPSTKDQPEEREDTLPDRLDHTLNRIVYEFSCELCKSTDGTELVKLVIVGQSFLLNQIRLMIGMALAVMQGALPEEAIDITLSSPIRIGLAMAPACALLLDSCSYAVDNPFQRGRPDAVSIGEEARLDIESFKQTVYQHVIKLFQTDEDAKQWQESMPHLHICPMHFGLLSQKYADWCKANEERKRQRVEKGTRIEKETGGGGDGGDKKDSEGDRRLLPMGLATTVCVKFGLKPGPVCSSVLRAIEDSVRKGTVPARAEIQVYVDHIQTHGLNQLMEQGRLLWEQQHPPKVPKNGTGQPKS